MLYYDRIDISEGIILIKVIEVKNAWFVNYCFFSHGFKLQDSACNCCHDLKMLRLNISDIAIITNKNVDYSWIYHEISKSEAINLLENSVVEGRSYI